jgi:hypothetical protein
VEIVLIANWFGGMVSLDCMKKIKTRIRMVPKLHPKSSTHLDLVQMRPVRFSNLKASAKFQKG